MTREMSHRIGAGLYAANSGHRLLCWRLLPLVPAQARTIEEQDEMVEDVTAQDAALLVEREVSPFEGLPKKNQVDPYDRRGASAAVESNQLDFPCLLTRHAQALHA